MILYKLMLNTTVKFLSKFSLYDNKIIWAMSPFGVALCYAASLQTLGAILCVWILLSWILHFINTVKN